MRFLSLQSYVRLNLQANTLYQITKEIPTLVRIHNCHPVFSLHVLGGWLAEPSWRLFLIPTFWTSYLVSQCMIMASTVLQKRNVLGHPEEERVSIKEASAVCVFLGSLSLFLSFFVLHDMGNFINNILFVVMYSHVFKKIPFIKNVYCAGMVANSVSYACQHSSLENTFTTTSHLYKLMRFIFMTFLGNEILLDIQHVKNDKVKGIPTLAVLWGIRKAFLMATFCILIGLVDFIFVWGWNLPTKIVLFLSLFPLFFDILLVFVSWTHDVEPITKKMKLYLWEVIVLFISGFYKKQ